MDRLKYLDKIGRLKAKHKKELSDACTKQALDTNPVKIGDLVTDHYHVIKVSEIGVYLDINKPSCIYYGQLYTKAGKPSKEGTGDPVYQMNLKLINKKETKRL